MRFLLDTERYGRLNALYDERTLLIGALMPQQATIQDALKREKLDLPSRPVVEAIEAGYIVDSSGEDSLEVWVVLSDATRDEELTGDAIMQIKSTISESLLKSGVELFPYIRIVNRSDYEGVEEPA